MSKSTRFSPIAIGFTALASLTMLVACDSSRPADSTRNGRVTKAKCKSDLAFDLSEVYQQRKQMKILSANGAVISAQPVDAKIRTVFEKDEIGHTANDGVAAFSESSVQEEADISVSKYECETLTAVLHYPGFEQGRELTIKNVDVNKIEFETTDAAKNVTTIKVEIPYPEKIKKLEKAKFAKNAIENGENKIMITETKLVGGLKQETIIISDAKAAASDADIYKMQLSTLKKSASKLNVDFEKTDLGIFVRQNMSLVQKQEVAGKPAAVGEEAVQVSASVRQLKQIFRDAQRKEIIAEGAFADTATASDDSGVLAAEPQTEESQGLSVDDVQPKENTAAEAAGVVASNASSAISIAAPTEQTDDNDAHNVLASEDKTVAEVIKDVQEEEKQAQEQAQATKEEVKTTDSERIQSIEAGLKEYDKNQAAEAAKKVEPAVVAEEEAKTAAQMDVANSEALKKLTEAGKVEVTEEKKEEAAAPAKANTATSASSYYPASATGSLGQLGTKTIGLGPR